jgi:hypothetical protein
MAQITFTDAWLAGAAEPQETEIMDENGKLVLSGRWTLLPVDDSRRKAWQQRFHLCSKCGGLGFLPLGKHAPKCPSCGGREGQPSFSDPKVRQSIFEEIVVGWDGFETASGKEIDYNRTLAGRLAAEHQDVFFAVLRSAEALHKLRVEADEGN